ncbi:unnamed protein product [Caenorhabditis nigoni]
MGSWNRRNQISDNDAQGDYKDLLVFGYASTIFPNDYQSEHIAEERHMVPCLGDSENRVDRYDCRLLLPSLDIAITRSSIPPEHCETEAIEEDMCEEERYQDMHTDMQREQEEEEERRRKEQRNAIGFDYGTGTVKEPESDSEDEPFEPPEGIKFPVGLELPPNMKLHHIIEKTAAFIVANGTQMEIVIKAKQRNNAEQFGFLEFDNKLNPFYKYLQKLIREKKYTPELGKRPKKLAKKASSTSKPAVSSSLAAIAAAHGSGSDSDDSDSDCELHPSLLSGSSKRPVSPENPSAIGPRKKPVEPEKPPPMNLKPAGDFSQRNDVYAALFKNLAHVTRQAAGIEEVKHGIEDSKKEEDDDPFRDERLDDPDYREWYTSFYGKTCPWVGPRPMIPPTPDLEPILNSYAETVAQKGAEIETSLAARKDLQLHFMDPHSPYYSYYHHKVRMHQWRMYHPQEHSSYPSPNILGSPVPLMSTDLLPPSTSSSPGPSSLMSLNISAPPEPPLNRRQRRRLLETSRVADDSLTEPGVFDPISMLPKSASTPANLQNLDNFKPVSFTLNGTKDESSFRFDPDMDDSGMTGPSEEFEGLPPPPPPPTLPGNTQTQVDRKERARIFMEKLLQEKKVRKQQEDEERAKLEEETRRKAERISESLSGRRSVERSSYAEVSREKKSLDDIINSKINSVLSESGFHPEEEKKEAAEVDRERDRKKHRKRSRSRRRSRSRSRSSDHKKSRRHHHRSRSRSRDRHRRNRSRSRERSYRR